MVDEPASGMPRCRHASACPIFRTPEDRYFCPGTGEECDARCGLPGLLAGYERISPKDSVELKISVATLKLQKTLARLKDAENLGASP